MLVRYRTLILMTIAVMVVTAAVAAPFAAPVVAQGCCYVDDCEPAGSPTSICVTGEYCEHDTRNMKCGPIFP